MNETPTNLTREELLKLCDGNLKIHTRKHLEDLAARARATLSAMPPGEMGDWVHAPENPTGIPMRRIPFAPGYAASEDGCIYSLPRSVDRGVRGVLKFPFRQLKPSMEETKRYKVCCLRINGRHKTFRVHQLVASAFLGWTPMDPFKRQVDHKNRATMDNSIVNLRLVTASLNNINRSGSGIVPASGLRGVYRGRHGGWIARIFIDGTLINLCGAVTDPKEAFLLREEAENVFWNSYDNAHIAK